jgi:hypothetical protein
MAPGRRFASSWVIASASMDGLWAVHQVVHVELQIALALHV